MHALAEQQQSGTFTDLTVHVEGRQFLCHRAVLVASSPYFQALLRHEPDVLTSPVLHLDQVSAVGFEMVLSYIYTGTVRVNSTAAVNVLEAADFLQFRTLASACSRFLLQHIVVDNALSSLELGVGHSFPGLAWAARKYVMEEFHRVMRTPNFLDLTPDALEDLLSDKDITIPSDEHLLAALCQWGIHREGREPRLLSMLNHVRMDNISQDTTQTLLMEYPFLEKVFETSGQIQEHVFHDVSPNAEGVGSDSMATFSGSEPQQNNCDNLQNVNAVMKDSDTDGASVNRPRDELMVIIPRDTTSHFGLKQLTLLYHCAREQKWKPLTKLPFDNRSMFSVSVLQNNIYVIGGRERFIPTNLCHVYHPNDCSLPPLDDGNWSSMASMIHARAQHSSVAVGGRIYVVGGRSDFCPGKEYLADAEIYNPDSNQWTQVEGSTYIRSIFRPALIPYDDKILVIGGSQMLPDVWGKDYKKCIHTGVYSLHTGTLTWESEDEFSQCLKEQNISVGMGDCFVIDGIVVLIDEDTRGKKIRLYNPLDQSMRPLISSHGQHRFAGYLYRHNVLYCTGGLAYLNAPNDMVHTMDLSANMGWKMMSSLPQPHSHHACVLLHQ